MAAIAVAADSASLSFNIGTKSDSVIKAAFKYIHHARNSKALLTAGVQCGRGVAWPLRGASWCRPLVATRSDCGAYRRCRRGPATGIGGWAQGLGLGTAPRIGSD
jgi:hypothetical protein